MSDSALRALVLELKADMEIVKEAVAKLKQESDERLARYTAEDEAAKAQPKAKWWHLF